MDYLTKTHLRQSKEGNSAGNELCPTTSMVIARSSDELSPYPRPPMGIPIGNENFNRSLTNDVRKLYNIAGYVSAQRNGQITLRPIRDWQHPAPGLECEVFIGKLPEEVLENELLPIFLSVGPLYEFRLLLQFNGLNRGYAFAWYGNQTDARTAVIKLNGYEIRPEHYIGVRFSRQNTSLYIKNLPYEFSMDDAVKFICQRTEDVAHIAMNTVKPGGFIENRDLIVYYKNHRAAALGRKHLLSETCIEWRRYNVIVDWAGSPHTHHRFLNQNYECAFWSEHYGFIKWNASLNQKFQK